ncbi:MAG: hypothetical protein JSU09_01360 [Bacteroidetes bacterium]|nr:hypothetical protein [Bacteroidota bacterium]
MTSCTLEIVNLTERGIILDDKDDISSSKEILQPGTHLIPMYDDFVKIEIIPKDYEDEFKCLTKDKREVIVKAKVQYYPIPDQVADLYSDFGDNYFEYFVTPEFRAAIRKSIGQYDSMAIDKTKIELRVKKILDSVYNHGHIAIQNFKIDWEN